MADDVRFAFSPSMHEEIIKLCQNETDRDVIEGARLGYYDEFDRYIVPNEIRQELLDMPKIITGKTFDEQGTEILDLFSPIPLFDGIKFKLTIGEKESVLYIIEEVFDEEQMVANIFEEMLDVIPLSLENRLPNEIIFSNYHIIDGDEDDAKELVFDIENILIRKIYLTLLARQIRDIDGLETEETFNKIMDVLKEGGEYGLEILADFAEEMKTHQEIYNITSQKQYQKKVTGLLMASVEKVSTKARLEDPKNNETYRKIKKLRNKELSKYLFGLNNKIDAEKVVDEAKQVQENFVFKDNEKNEKIEKEFYSSKGLLLNNTSIEQSEEKSEAKAILKSKDAPADKKSEKEKRIAAPVLKQNKQKKIEEKQASTPSTQPQTKEDKIREILEKSQNKETKKVVPAANAQKSKSGPPKPYKSLSSKGKSSSKPKSKTAGKKPASKKKPAKTVKPKIKGGGGPSKGKVNKPKPKGNTKPPKFSAKKPAAKGKPAKKAGPAFDMRGIMRREMMMKNGMSRMRPPHGMGRPPMGMHFGQGPHRRPEMGAHNYMDHRPSEMHGPRPEHVHQGPPMGRSPEEQRIKSSVFSHYSRSTKVDKKNVNKLGNGIIKREGLYSQTKVVEERNGKKFYASLTSVYTSIQESTLTQ